MSGKEDPCFTPFSWSPFISRRPLSNFFGKISHFSTTLQNYFFLRIVEELRTFAGDDDGI